MRAIPILCCDIETAKSSEKDMKKMETAINDLKEKLSQEQDKCKRLQDDLSSYTERESKMSQSMTSVRMFFIFRIRYTSKTSSKNIFDLFYSGKTG